MVHRRYLGAVLAALLMTGGISAWLAGCSVEIRPDAVSFTILGKLLTLTFADIGPITTEANQVAKVPTAVRLFDEVPSQTPPTGQMTLPSTSVGVARRLTAKSIIRSQTLPQSGSATIRFNVAAGQSAVLCDSATLLAEFEMSLVMGIPAILNEVYDLSPQAIAVMMANDVTICIEITADFDGDITISEYYFAFGGGAAGNQPPDSPVGPPILPGGLTQVPIDSLGGLAVAAPINRTISGISYGVVGVLEGQSAAVTGPPTEPSTITVVPAALGLLAVDTLYIGTHSAFVPDMSGGVTLATLTVGYTDGGSPTTLDFVTGSTTAEWSYDRPEHTTAYGGVPHSQATVLYSFDSTVDSTSVYKGYSYAVTLPLDSARTISSLSLSMADPASFAGSRIETGFLSTWAAQGLTAITLAGRALVIPQACCLSDESCADLGRDDCIARSGEPQGDGTTCASTDCTTPGGGDEPEACCISPARGYELLTGSGRFFEQICEDIGPPGVVESREICLEISGVPQGLGTTCATTVCNEDFRACCAPVGSFSGSLCEELLFDECASFGWDPQASGVHCDAFPCPTTGTDQACCKPDGTCSESLSVNDCTAQGGSVNGRGTTCADVTCQPAQLTWVLSNTVTNWDNDPVETVGTGRYEGTITTYTITETSISVHDREVDNGFEWYDVNMHSVFDSPPVQLIPGETFDVSVQLSHSGTVEGFPPWVQAEYRGTGIDVTPDATFQYGPWSDGFTGVSSMTWTFTVPTAGAGGEISIVAFWWNCPSCDITWIFRAQ